MTRRLIGLLALLALAGCSAAPAGDAPSPTPPVAAVTEAPADGVLLTALGFRHAPEGFSIPRNSVISDRIDAGNNVTVVFSAPTGVEIAAYLRRNLPAMGFKITADKNNSLLFRGGEMDGAYTASGPTSALTLRTDRERG